VSPPAKSSNDTKGFDSLLRTLARAPAVALRDWRPRDAEPALPTSLVGSTLDGFRIEERVAAGGFGVVYRAQQLALDRPVALKVLRLRRPARAAQRALEEDLLEEARTLARLRHPHIVKVHDWGVASSSTGVPLPWIAFEWLDGTTLERALYAERGRGDSPRPPLPPGQAVDLLRPVLRAIAYAHRRGVVHCDLTPANLFVAHQGERRVLKVLDFGNATTLTREEARGRTRKKARAKQSPYTLHYAAPEQLRGSATGPWTDVHALGLLLLELMTGQRPSWESRSEMALAAAGSWAHVLAKALAKRPADRHADAGALLRALQSVSGGALPPGPARSAVSA
jgi:serine/threonine-protein kinase